MKFWSKNPKIQKNLSQVTPLSGLLEPTLEVAGLLRVVLEHGDVGQGVGLGSVEALPGVWLLRS